LGKRKRRGELSWRYDFCTSLHESRRQKKPGKVRGIKCRDPLVREVKERRKERREYIPLALSSITKEAACNKGKKNRGSFVPWTPME